MESPFLDTKRLREKRPDSKASIKWKGDERKRLKVCISALMQMRFHDQLAYSGHILHALFVHMIYIEFCLCFFCIYIL